MLIAKFMYPDNGYEAQQHVAKDKLVVGEEYLVRDVMMGQSNTSIFLVGPTGVFNSVFFDFYEDGEPIDIYRSPKYNPYLGRADNG